LYSYAKPGKSDTEVTNLHIHQVEAVKYLHSTHLPVRFRVLRSYQEGCTQDWCSWSMVSA